MIGLSDSFNENRTRWQGRHEETFPPPPPRAFTFVSPVLKFMCQSRTVFLQNNARGRVLKVFDLLFCSGFVRLAGKTKMQYFSFLQVSQKNKENLSMKLHKVLAWEPQVLGLKKRLVILHIFILCLGAVYMEGETSWHQEDLRRLIIFQLLLLFCIQCTCKRLYFSLVLGSSLS